MKSTSIFLAGLLCLALAIPGYGKQRKHAKKSPVNQEASAALVVPATPPPTLAQAPASAPRVAFQSGELTISAKNSTLGDILKAVQSQTGAQVDFPGNAAERVVGSFGPGPARDVLTSLLNGSHFNYLLLGSPTDPNALDRVILMAKSSGADNTSPQPVEQAANQPVYAVRPMAAPMGTPGANTVVVEGQDAQDDGNATDDSADATDDAQADDQTDQTDDQATDDQPATDEQQPQQQEGQPNVKTPEQLLQELQRQQQIQQQGGQPGVPLGGLPTPGFPPGIQPGQPIPHNQ